jgi:hypothetical protein
MIIADSNFCYGQKLLSGDALHLFPEYIRLPQTTMSPTRNRKGKNSRRRKRTLLKKAYEYGKLSGADIAFFIYQSGRWCTYRSTDRQSFPPSWEQIVSVVTKYIHIANKKTANVISTPGKSATRGFPTSRAGLLLSSLIPSFYDLSHRQTSATIELGAARAAIPWR